MFLIESVVMTFIGGVAGIILGSVISAFLASLAEWPTRILAFSIALNTINLGEILYIVKREFGDQKKIEVLANIERLKFITLPCPNDLIFRATEYKAEYAMSYADCFVLASAIEHDAVIVTGDPEFKKVKDLASIIFI